MRQWVTIDEETREGEEATVRADLLNARLCVGCGAPRFWVVVAQGARLRTCSLRVPASDRRWEAGIPSRLNFGLQISLWQGFGSARFSGYSAFFW
jgi:hypothetical protein